MDGTPNPQETPAWRTRGYLPHIDRPGLIQMVTWRLADSMSAERRRDWELLMNHPELAESRRKIQAYLDLGYGNCWLQNPAVAQVIQELLVAQDGIPYKLYAWVIMPNHVHVLVETMPGNSLGTIVKKWKGASARICNQLLGRTGEFWYREYYDRYIRDSDHFARAVQYIHENPVVAGLVKLAAEWPWSSAARLLPERAE
ncbi:MAG: transposase [bacterium]